MVRGPVPRLAGQMVFAEDGIQFYGSRAGTDRHGGRGGLSGGKHSSFKQLVEIFLLVGALRVALFVLLTNMAETSKEERSSIVKAFFPPLAQDRSLGIICLFIHLGGFQKRSEPKVFEQRALFSPGTIASFFGHRLHCAGTSDLRRLRHSRHAFAGHVASRNRESHGRNFGQTNSGVRVCRSGKSGGSEGEIGKFC